MGKHKIIEIRKLTESTYVVRLEKNGIAFQSGQFILLNKVGSIERREYSVYSGEKDNFLEVLIRVVEGGKVSGQLKQAGVGSSVEVDGPYGFFKFHPKMFPSNKFLFVATGTGVSPFHSFVKIFPGLDYQLIHGVRFISEAYDHHDFNKQKVTLCTSGEENND